MTRDLTPQLRRDIAMNFDHTEAAPLASTPLDDERRLIVRIVLVIAAACAFAVISAS